MKLRVLIPTAVAAFGLGIALPASSVASGVYAPPQTQVTVQMPGGTCSVTEHGPVFPYNNAGWTMTYGGGVSCAGAIGQKTLSVYAQVAGQDGKTWFTIFGSGLVQGPTPINPLRLRTTRTAYLGHAYRIVAVGHVELPSGKTLSATAYSHGWAP